jgi:hypothetical protein
MLPPRVDPRLRGEFPHFDICKRFTRLRTLSPQVTRNYDAERARYSPKAQDNAAKADLSVGQTPSNEFAEVAHDWMSRIVRRSAGSGVPGVHFLRTTNEPSGIWQAMIKLANGKRISKTFSVRKFGRKDGFRLAVEARREMVAAIPDKPYLYSLAAKRKAGYLSGGTDQSTRFEANRTSGAR